MPFIPHTKEETNEMLREIGVDSIKDLFNEIPKHLIIQSLTNIPEGLTEFEVKKVVENKFNADLVGNCFIGAGAYEHHIPAAVAAIISRGEFLTAYTPYQAEASQGNLQLIYEYQTMMASLMGLEASNASVYDGSNALAESILMSIRIRKQKQKIILLPKTVHPAYRYVVKSIVSQQGIVINEVDYNPATGQIDIDVLKKFEGQELGALVIPQPNFFGVLEDVDILTDWAHEHDAIVIGLVNPLAMSLLKEPGQWGQNGADIACGEGQPLGISLSSGGPYFGFMACKMKYIRQMPGRIVGRTIDHSGKEGFTLTLQAREQHIRRGKATSNICTNQGLMVTATTIYMSLLGATGLAQAAKASHAGAKQLLQQLITFESVVTPFSSPLFHEFAIQLDQPVAALLELLAMNGIQGGYDLSQDYPELGNALLSCVTETKLEADIQNYCRMLGPIIKRITVSENCEIQS